MAHRLCLTLLLLVGIAAAQNRTIAKCQSFSISAELVAGNNFHLAITNDLVFRLSPEDLMPEMRVNRWHISVGPEGNVDYIYPVNIPLRFNSQLTLGAIYGEDAKGSLGSSHEMRFLLSKADYERLLPKLDYVLWPCTAPDPDHASDEYLGN